MNKLLISLSFLLIALSSHAQAVEGKVKYIAEHSWTKQAKYMNYLTPQQIERMTYTWGRNDTWRVVNELYFNPTESKYIDSKEQLENDEYASRSSAYTIHRDFKTNKIKDHIQVDENKYVIEDTLIPQQWKIISEIKEVLGHPCIKALTYDSLKNQHIVAWFAQDIPVAAGPERFCGLPGLIMELNYNDGALVITASTIELRKLTPDEIKMPNKLKGKKINNEAYLKLLREHIKTAVKMERYPYWGIRYS